MISLHNEDCLPAMRTMANNEFDLAIVDPPYGIGADVKNSGRKLQSTKSAALSKDYGRKSWDKAPDATFFNELTRCTKRQIIWGANYFGLVGGMIFWHKNVTMPTYSDGELAWKSWEVKLDYVNITWHGMIQQDMTNKEQRIHPTQKPVKLYEWLLHKYAKEGDTILDTHLGSGSIAIACDNYGFDLTGYEIDKDYFNAATKRLDQHQSQLTMFENNLNLQQ